MRRESDAMSNIEKWLGSLLTERLITHQRLAGCHRWDRATLFDRVLVRSRLQPFRLAGRLAHR